MTRLERLMADAQARHPRNLAGIREARAVAPDRFEEIAERFLRWALATRGDDALPAMLDAFARFSSDVILEQARYEASGRYASSSFAECQAAVYDEPAVMDEYLWGIYLTNFLWAHHFELCLFYERAFLSRLRDRVEADGDDEARIVEIAPGHGGWGVWALDEIPASSLAGYDISASSVRIAARMADAANVGERAKYHQCNALELDPETTRGNALICCFVVEHLEDPNGLFAAFERLLAPGGLGFVTGALTAAQIDHIYEFRYESELVTLCERHGLRVIETFSGSPRRTLPGARFLPRSMGLVVERRRGELW